MKNTENLNTESNVWNFAQTFVNLKILMPLVECDKLYKVALYGAEYLEDSLQLPCPIKSACRIEAIKRYASNLKMAMNSANFELVKKALSENKIKQFKNDLKLTEKHMEAMYSITTNQQIQQEQIEINEEHFINCLTDLHNIHSQICGSLNEGGFIFPSSDEIDLDKIKKELIEGG